jgi:fatty acid desaturase
MLGPSTAPPPPAEFNQLLRIEPSGFIARLLILLLMGTAGVIGTVHTANFYSLPFQLLIAIAMAHSTELAHQCIHKTGTGDPFWDRTLGIALCWPSLVCFRYYRWFHLWHHKENGSDKDAESFGYTYAMMQDPLLCVRLEGFIRHISMVDHFANTIRRLYFAVTGSLGKVLRSEMPQMSANAARNIQSEYRWMALLSLMVIGASLSFGSIVLRLWIIPLVFWAPIHAMIELPEHWATALRPNTNVFDNTRSIRAGWFANWYTNANCYHVEHHQYSAIPMQRLHELHNLLSDSGIKYRYLDHGYASFYRCFFTLLWTGGQRRSPTSPCYGSPSPPND